RRLCQYRCAVLRHSLTQARVRERGGAIPIHVDRLVRRVRLADVCRAAGRLHDRGRRNHHRGRALYLLARTCHVAQRAERGYAMTSPTRSGTPAGIGLMLLGIFLFCCNDALGKWILGTYSVAQMILIRSTVALLLLAPFIWRAGR